MKKLLLSLIFVPVMLLLVMIAQGQRAIIIPAPSVLAIGDTEIIYCRGALLVRGLTTELAAIDAEFGGNPILYSAEGVLSTGVQIVVSEQRGNIFHIDIAGTPVLTQGQLVVGFGFSSLESLDLIDINGDPILYTLSGC